MLEESISVNIRLLRKKAKMTLQELADRTGLTKSYLSKIERKKQTPSFSTMNKIAVALGVDSTTLLVENSEQIGDLRLSFTKKTARKLIIPLDRLSEGTLRGIKFEAMAFDKPGKNMDPLIMTISDEAPLFQHEGEEFIFVLEGKQEFTYGGEKYIMEEGDSVYFDASVPHTGKGMDGKPAKLLLVMFNYKRL